MTHWLAQVRHLQEDVKQRAMENAVFRAQLKADPYGTIERECGLSAGVLRQAGVRIRIDLEPNGAADVEFGGLTEDQLAVIAGAS